MVEDSARSSQRIPAVSSAFRTIPTWLKRDSTIWTYRFSAVIDGTEVAESYEIARLPPRPILALIRRLLPHHLDMRPDMQRTLEALKSTAERGVVLRADSAAATSGRPIPGR